MSTVGTADRRTKVPLPPLPPRKVSKGHFAKYLVSFPSRKNNRNVVCESLLEANYCIRLEHSQDVVSYRERPTTIQLSESESYTPDFFVERQSSETYTEVKPDFRKTGERYRRKLNKATIELYRHGYVLEYADEESINCGELLSNLKTLYFHSFAISKEEYDYALRQIGTLQDPATLQSLIEDLQVTPKSIYRLLFEGKLLVNLHKPLSLNSLCEVENGN